MQVGRATSLPPIPHRASVSWWLRYEWAVLTPINKTAGVGLTGHREGEDAAARLVRTS